MTIAEFILLGGVLLAAYLLLPPLQRWLETRLLKIFGSLRQRLRRPVIDVSQFISHSKDARRMDR